KDLTAYLRILCNPLDNEAILRVINVPRRGIGDKSVQALTEYSEKHGYSYFDGVYDADFLDINSGAKAKISGFKDVLAKLIIDKETMNLSELVQSVIKRTDFMSCFSDDTAQNEEKRANVNEFCNSVDEFMRLNPNASLSEYLNSITLSSDTDEINDGNFITLATVHSVKGLEYKCVFICGLDKEIFPIERAYSDPDDLEEERRLMYVAITRARERLYFTRARSRYLYGNRRPTVQSEFLDELSDKLGIVKKDRSYSRFSGGYDDYGDDYGGSSSYGRRGSSSYGGGYGGYNDSSYGSSYGGFGGFGAGYGGRSSNNAYDISKKYSAKTIESSGAAGENDESAFKTGMKVRHKKFGDGIIVAIKDSGGYKIGDVAFKGVGVKSLVLKLAPIEILDK
ncbi:MAG: ATP-binding domain-containing protein, partial [Clostridia bacterium]|nr:ATP-binding domain-containing protein [Clostridia bacterium]